MRLLVTAVLLALGASSCSKFHITRHPQDLERPAPTLASGACDRTELVEPSTLFARKGVLAERAPAAGTRVALEGRPKANATVTLLACNSECCQNKFESRAGCSYVLLTLEGNENLPRREGLRLRGHRLQPLLHALRSQARPALPLRGNAQLSRGAPRDGEPAGDRLLRAARRAG